MQASILLPLVLVALVEQISTAPYCPMPQIIKMEQYRNKSQDECIDLQEPEWYGFPTPVSDDTFFDLCCKKNLRGAPRDILLVLHSTESGIEKTPSLLADLTS